MIQMQENSGVSKYLIEQILFEVEDHQERIRVNYCQDDNKKKLYYVTEYYGDHSENWIVFEDAGKEIGRTNTKYIVDIKWSDRLNN